MTTSHANCDHPATREDRAACRKARALRASQIDALCAYFASRAQAWDDPYTWIYDGARRFARQPREGHTVDQAADALLTYFLDPAIAASAGRKPTADPATIRSIILHAAS